MNSLIKKITVFFRKLFQKNYHQLEDNSIANKMNELSESLKQKEIILSEEKVKLNEEFKKLIVYRDSLNLLMMKYEKEKILIEEKIDIAKKETAHSDTLSEQYKLEVLSLGEKKEKIHTELNKQKEINRQLLEAKSKEVQSHKAETMEKEALKSLIRDLQIENKKIQKINQESIDREKHLINLLQLTIIELANYEQPAMDSQNGSQIEVNNVDISGGELNSTIEKEAHDSKTPAEQTISEDNFLAENDNIESVVEKIFKDPDSNQIPASEFEAPNKESYTIDPENRGGRKRITESEESVDRESSDEKVISYKPKIVCWKDETVWGIGLELPDEVIECFEVTVSQNNLPLVLDERRGSIFKLISVSGRIQTATSDNNILDIELSNEGYLIFKLTASNFNEGILVKHTSTGNYLAIVPNDWRFDENVAGQQIAGIEDTSLNGFSAYHFHLKVGSNQKVGFINFNNESIVVDSLIKFCTLQGNFLEDSAERQGPLFGEKIPNLEIIDSVQWARIDCIIIGEEGDDRENWRKKIETSPKQIFLKLSDYLPNNSGRYFIRFYDADLQLVDSCDFRFISSLLKIEYNNLNLLPDEFGHSATEIDLIHTSDFILKSDNPFLNEIAVTTITPEKTKIIVKPNPEIDKLTFDISSKQGRTVKLFIPMEQIWWAVNQGDSPELWQDKIINLTPADFLTLNKSIFFRFPAKSWTSAIRFGFQGRELRSYPVCSDLIYLRIPLRDYSDSEFEMTSLGNHILVCEIFHNGEVLNFNPFKVVVNAKCKYCDNYGSISVENIATHIIENHFDLVYVEPLYDDIQPLLPYLPKKIYHCVYCPDSHYIKSSSAYPVDDILRHIDQKHYGQRDRFRVVDDIDEIRQIISIEIPNFKKCKICDKCFPEPDWKTHLIRRHEEGLILRS